MLENTITLGVDIANNGTLVDEDWTRHEENLNRTTYVGEDYSVANPAILNLYRTAPKPSGNFLGTAKNAFKFSIPVVVEGRDGTPITSAYIFEVSSSMPVGVNTDKQLEMRQRGIALLDKDSVMVPFCNKQAI